MRALDRIVPTVVTMMTGWLISSPLAVQAAKEFPKKPIRFLVPAAAGAGNDLTARAIGQKLTDAWNRQVVVDNRGGAAGALAIELAAKAPPDGYTLLMATTSLPIGAATNPKWPYDVAKDFTAISLATTLFYVVYHSPALPVKSVDGLITYAKANPGKLNYGSTGAGSLMHLAWELFGHMAGVKLAHIPYKGGAQVISATLSGELQLGFATVISLRPHLPAGRLRPLAITARNRSSSVPELPTLAEAGLSGYEAMQWYGVIAGGKLPAVILKKLNSGIVEALKSPDVVQRLTADGSTPVGSSPGEFTAHINAEITKWRDLVKRVGLVLH